MTTALQRGEHGTATGWRQGCRCSRCRSGLRLSAQVWLASAQLRRGRDPATRVSPRRLLEHLDELAAAGVTAREAARRAGVSESTLYRARGGGRHISRIVETAVLRLAP